MKYLITGIGLLLGSTAPVLAGGIERAPQSLAPLFEEGDYVELSFGGVDPDVSGRDLALFGGRGVKARAVQQQGTMARGRAVQQRPQRRVQRRKVAARPQHKPRHGRRKADARHGALGQRGGGE